MTDFNPDIKNASHQYIVRAPIFPLYSHVKYALQAWADENIKSIRTMMSDIQQQTGTPQNPIDWTEPDNWIEEKLSGESKRLAQKIWQISNHRLNPRHTYGCYLLINRLKLLTDNQGIWCLEQRGNDFLSDNEKIIREIDEGEGIPYLLSLLAKFKSCKRGDIIDDWGNYLRTVSKFSTYSVFKDTLSRRLLNLIERGLVMRDSNRYEITPSGIRYLKQISQQTTNPIPLFQNQNKGKNQEQINKTEMLQTLQKFRESQEQALRKKLITMDPYAFEYLIKDLLVAMDYDNVEVTKQSGDKGVDVVANFQFGITEITEVVQVKRTESNIGRPIIDALRGALPYHGAIRGTIITLGGFVKGVEKDALFPGAAPITLIDGDQLIKSLIKHKIGIKEIPAPLWELDETAFDIQPNDGALLDSDI